MTDIALTKDEAADLWRKAVAAGAKLMFSSYYKYSFTFAGKADGIVISVSTGGDSDDIYRFSVDADKPLGEYPEMEAAAKEHGFAYVKRLSDGATGDMDTRW